MEKTLKFFNITQEQKRALLKALGYEILEDGFLYDKKNGKPYICPNSDEKVSFDSATIVPGSLLVIKGDPLSVSKYLSEFEEKQVKK